MLKLWAFLGPILVSDVLNPVLLGILIYALGSRRPYRTAVSLVAGHTVTYFSAGILLAIGFEKLTQRLENPQPPDYVVGAVVGVALLWLTYWSTRPASPTAQQESGPKEIGPVKAFVTGAIINIIGIPFAVPYFAALDQILKADLDWAGSIIVLAVYNILYASPFLAVIALRMALGKRAGPLLEKINQWMERAAGILMPVLFGLLGLLLLADSGKYFLTGTGIL